MAFCRYMLGAAFAQKPADSPNNFQALIYMLVGRSQCAASCNLQCMSSIVWQALVTILLLLMLVSLDFIQHHADHVCPWHTQGCLVLVC